MEISIIIPVYHEEKNIEKLLKQIASKVKTPHSTLIVYDSKKDPTYPAVKKILPKYPFVDLLQNSNGSKKGVINAVKTGIAKSTGKAIVIVMGDLSDEISIIDKMYKLIEKGNDIVAASRYSSGGKKVGGPLLKTVLSRIAGVSLYYLFHIPTKDATNAYKMYRRSIFNEIEIESTGGFEYSLEIVLKAYKKGYKITEIPSIWYDRMEGKSNFKLLKWLPKYIYIYLIVLRQENITNTFRKKIQTIPTHSHLTILACAYSISLFLFLLLAFIIPFHFAVQKTDAINWLTINNYPKQKDYFFFFTFIGFTYFFSLLLWFLWVTYHKKI